MRFGWWAGPMLRTHRAGKGPGGRGGMWLRLKEQKGPRRAPNSWFQRAGDLTWEPSRLPGLKLARQTPSFPLLLLLLLLSWRAPSTCLSCSTLSLLPMTPGPMRSGGRGGLGGQGTSLGSQQAPWARVGGANTL